MNEHINKQFDVELDRIRTRVLHMGGSVETQVLAALAATEDGNLESMREIVRNDRRVDAYEVGIDEECTPSIARRQPTARDLRLVAAISRLVTDRERIGDKAAKIANKSRQLHRSGGAGIPRLAELQDIGRLAADMLPCARRFGTPGSDDGTADHRSRQCSRQRLQRHHAPTDYRHEGRSTHDRRGIGIVWIAKAIERIGDHATHIAESIVYIGSGEDIRHAANLITKTEN